jgi:flagellar basal-body rod protein FlgG
MLKALNTAATGMAAQQTNIDVIANNIANVNTNGFHRSRAEFQDLVYQTIRVPGGTTGNGERLPTGIQIGHGTRTVSTEPIHIQGNLRQTNGSLDVAIEGAGFLQITRPSGEIGYTRAGTLNMNAEGQVVTVDGFLLEPSISIPTDAVSITISADGTVSVVQPGSTASQEVGRITLAGFANPAGLQNIGRNLYTPTDASGQPIVANPGEEGLGTLSQGFLEGSNVEVVNEMIDLISSQRAYEINQRVIQAADQMLQRTTER